MGQNSEFNQEITIKNEFKCESRPGETEFDKGKDVKVENHITGDKVQGPFDKEEERTEALIKARTVVILPSSVHLSSNIPKTKSLVYQKKDRIYSQI